MLLIRETQNYNDIPVHIYYNALEKKKIGKDMIKFLHIAIRNIKQCSHFGKQFGNFL